MFESSKIPEKTAPHDIFPLISDRSIHRVVLGAAEESCASTRDDFEMFEPSIDYYVYEVIP